jgi:1-acyl-sn-glycerol-3-phosphate acyltransferase
VSVPPFHWWRTVCFLIPTLVVYTTVLGTMSLLSGLVDARGVFAHSCAQWWSRLLLWTAGIKVTRAGSLPPADISCIIVANHSSHYDTPILFATIPRQLRIIAKATLRHVPFVGWHLSRTGHLLIDRKNPGAGVLKRMQRIVRQGASLIVYPEGARTRDGRMLKFKGGVFLLAIENGLPIVPVTIAGSRIVMPRGRLMVCPADVRVTVHEPISTEGLARDDARALAERVKAIVAGAI